MTSTYREAVVEQENEVKRLSREIDAVSDQLPVSIQSRFRASDATFRTSRVINSLLQAVRPSGMAEASGPESSSGVVAPDWNALEEAMGSTLGDKDLDFDRTLNLVDGEGNSAQFGENLLQLVRCNKCSKLFKPDIINEHLKQYYDIPAEQAQEVQSSSSSSSSSTTTTQRATTRPGRRARVKQEPTQDNYGYEDLDTRPTKRSRTQRDVSYIPDDMAIDTQDPSMSSASTQNTYSNYSYTTSTRPPIVNTTDIWSQMTSSYLNMFAVSGVKLDSRNSPLSPAAQANGSTPSIPVYTYKRQGYLHWSHPLIIFENDEATNTTLINNNNNNNNNTTIQNQNQNQNNINTQTAQPIKSQEDNAMQINTQPVQHPNVQPSAQPTQTQPQPAMSTSPPHPPIPPVMSNAIPSLHPGVTPGMPPAIATGSSNPFINIPNNATNTTMGTQPVVASGSGQGTGGSVPSLPLPLTMMPPSTQINPNPVGAPIQTRTPLAQPLSLGMPNPSPLIQPYQNPTPTSINNPALSKPPGQPSMGGVPPSTLSHIPNIQPFSAPAPMGVGVGMGLPGGVTSADLLQQQSAPLMTQGYMPSTVPSLAPGPSVPIAPPSEPPKYNTRSAGKRTKATPGVVPPQPSVPVGVTPTTIPLAGQPGAMFSPGMRPSTLPHNNHQNSQASHELTRSGRVVPLNS